MPCVIVGVLYMVAAGPLDRVLPPRASHLPEDAADSQDDGVQAPPADAVAVGTKGEKEPSVGLLAKDGVKGGDANVTKAGASGLAVDSNGWPVTIVDRARLALALCSVVCFPQQYHFPAYVAMSIC